MMFKNRISAGEKLAKALDRYKNYKDVIILGLPRGGVVVADVVAKKLNLELDVVVPRKIGSPDNPEYAIGALTEDGEPVWNKEAWSLYKFDKKEVDKVVEEERKEAKRRLDVFRAGKKDLDLAGKTAIIIDDGLATGLTMEAAIKSVKKKGAKNIIVAVPCSATDSYNRIKSEVDELISLIVKDFFGAVGQFYEGFEQVEDEEVVKIMKR